MLLYCLFFFVGCDTNFSEKQVLAAEIYPKPFIDKKKSIRKFKDTTIVIAKRKVVLKFSKSVICIGTAVLLPGWNFLPDDWCFKSSLCEKLLSNGYNLVMPDMGKSVYCNEIYPETRADWRSFPTRKWLTDTVFFELQKRFNLLSPEEKNCIIGLSTGARGVALVVLSCPKLFKCAAALSGDYDQRRMKNDNLMKGFYGEYEKYMYRWEGIDNVVLRVKEFNTPIYLGHGSIDMVVPPEQTKLFYEELIKAHPKLTVKLSMPKAGHDYKYWDSEVDSIISFFEKQK